MSTSPHESVPDYVNRNPNVPNAGAATIFDLETDVILDAVDLNKRWGFVRSFQILDDRILSNDRGIPFIKARVTEVSADDIVTIREDLESLAEMGVVPHKGLLKTFWNPNWAVIVRKEDSEDQGDVPE